MWKRFLLVPWIALASCTGVASPDESEPVPFNLTPPSGTALTVAADTPEPSRTPRPAFEPRLLHREFVQPDLSEEGRMILESEELAISFEFPPLPGEIIYEYVEWPEREWDPTGILAGWLVDRSDRSWKYTFAGCVSPDFQVGRMGWPTDAIRWDQVDDKYFVHYPLGRRIEVHPLRIISHPQGVQALVFDPDRDYWGEEFITAVDDRVAILNFPEGHHPYIGCISFYFYEQRSVEDIEGVLLSVRFLNGEDESG